MPEDIRSLKQLMAESQFALTPEAIGGQLSPSWGPPICQEFCMDGCQSECANWCHSPISYP